MSFTWYLRKINFNGKHVVHKSLTINERTLQCLVSKRSIEVKIFESYISHPVDITRQGLPYCHYPAYPATIRSSPVPRGSHECFPNRTQNHKLQKGQGAWMAWSLDSVYLHSRCCLVILPLTSFTTPPQLRTRLLRSSHSKWGKQRVS